ncbi:MAG TPA: serine/threonine-protein kinase, partial [Terriglobales bacterium]|nr:serine/threonine-protein kinase [Terriglobales bacterium]
MATKPIFEQTLGHYHLLERLGEGGMGVVYRARDEHLQRDVAVKVLPPDVVKDESARRRLRREALTLARLNHPNIGTLHDLDADGDVDFLVMEYVPGVTLASKLARGPLRESELIEYGIQLASALEEAHKHDVVHCDLKPSNLLITPSGQLKVLDFGLAQLHTVDQQLETATDSINVAGTLPYVAPEQLAGPQALDNRTDIYSCGVVLYEMATGRRAHAGKNVGALLESVLHRQPPPVRSLNPEIAPELETIIQKAMDKDPALRYQSARELKVDLQRLVSSQKLVTFPLQSGPAIKTRWMVGSLALIVVLSLTFEFLALRGKARPAASAAIAPRVVAVLPFDAVGGSPENQVLCRGLTDLLTARLTQISKQYSVEVVPASEVRGQGVNSIAAARQKLGVSLVVEGSWDFAGNRVMYSLVNAQTRRSLDAEFIRADMNDLFSAEHEVADSLLRMIAGELRPESSSTLPAEASAHPDAYQYYVRGVGYLLEYENVDSLKSAVALFGSSLERDPGFAPALAGTAEAYWRLFQETKDESWMPKAIAACRHAARLNDRLAPVYTTLGMIYQGT